MTLYYTERPIRQFSVWKEVLLPHTFDHPRYEYWNSAREAEPKPIVVGVRTLTLGLAQDFHAAGKPLWFRRRGRPLFQWYPSVSLTPFAESAWEFDWTDEDPYAVPSSVSITKSRPDLFPSKALLLAGDVLAFGETKHPDEKWKSMSVRDHLGAAYRHVLRWQTGETKDSETGLSHLVHSMVRLAMAAELEAKS